MSVYRIFVEKKKEFAIGAKSCFEDIKTSLRINNLKGVRLINRYDVDFITENDLKSVYYTVFSEPQVDDLTFSVPIIEKNERMFAIEYLPGQFDQRADSCAQCIQLSTKKEKPVVRSAKIYILSGGITDEEFSQIKSYLINPVESMEASFDLPESLKTNYDIPTTVETIDNFVDLSKDKLIEFIENYGLAMDIDDILFCQQYFKLTEKRNPTITEIKMIDTYWSDHCRHTTFLTNIDDVQIDCDYIKESFDKYKKIRNEIYLKRKKPITLMDLATIASKKLKKDGVLKDLDESEEINACSVKIKVEVDGQTEDWLLMFKNETHNHPTEIEPFGGAATCLGGAIRDPLSGRAYVYQAMRVTGADDPCVSLDKTIKGKLPQKKITRGAANGYSSYGNQIGIATGQVTEIYHPGYVAKRMEIGAVIAATPLENVVRTSPIPGDKIILLGGKTGRDGCGGATGSSKSHTLDSLKSCGAEVQKGNAPVERKIQRLFRNGDLTRLIKRCNDFGAGGVSVAIGELADGLIIDLDKVPKKYDGLTGTELAISESQERMAVVVSENDVEKFLKEAQNENLEANVVATVTENSRLVMNWNNNEIVNLSREFINSNGAAKHTDIKIENPKDTSFDLDDDFDFKSGMEKMAEDLNCCSQKGLSERFDSTIGAGTVLMPFGGKYQLTPTQNMVAKIPVLKGDTKTCSLMGYGFDPYLSEKSPYHGAVCAVIESVAKIVAGGGSYKKCWLTFQEYFERTKGKKERWGKPLAALLGAFEAQLELGSAAIGGKDSMSGSFEEIDVPPTLVSFAVSISSSSKVVSPEFKSHGNKVYGLFPEYDKNNLPCFDSVKSVFETTEKLIDSKKAKSVYTLGSKGIGEAIFKMALGNKIGFKFNDDFEEKDIFKKCYGGFCIEVSADEKIENGILIGETTENYAFEFKNTNINGEKLQKLWEDRLEPVFPVYKNCDETNAENFEYLSSTKIIATNKFAKPKVLIPVFPGTNCEYDTARAFQEADCEIFVIRNLSSSDVEQSVDEFYKSVLKSQIIMIPGGFSGGDEPDGSGKFINAFFRNPKITEAVNSHLKVRDGLMLGICNGFQALIKLGLVPYGEICEIDKNSPTLTFNHIGRHQSMITRTKICSNKSPWLSGVNVGDIHSVAISHGEGRFIADKSVIKQLAENGQIATQYVDFDGLPSMNIKFNPNASIDAIEGITSPCGRVLGKMGHSERAGVLSDIFKNIPGNKDQGIFRSGINYFK